MNSGNKHFFNLAEFREGVIDYTRVHVVVDRIEKGVIRMPLFVHAMASSTNAIRDQFNVEPLFLTAAAMAHLMLSQDIMEVLEIAPIDVVEGRV